MVKVPIQEARIFNKDAFLEAIELEDLELISLLTQTTKKITKKKDGWFVRNIKTNKGKLIANIENIRRWL